MACASGNCSTPIFSNDSKLSTQNADLSSSSSSLSLSTSTTRRTERRTRVWRMAAPAVKAETLTIDKSRIKVVRNPPGSKLTDLGVHQWPKWGCPPSKFP